MLDVIKRVNWNRSEIIVVENKEEYWDRYGKEAGMVRCKSEVESK